MKKLKNKTALITGGAGGLGRAIAMGLLEEGATVSILDIDEDALNGFATELEQHLDGAWSGRYHTSKCDVAEPTSCQQAIEHSNTIFGPPDILVNNAALGMQHIRADHMTNLVTIDELDPMTWKRFVDVNLSGAFYMTQSAVKPMLRRRSGRIINITTSFFTMLRGKFHPYGPSKAGMEAMAAGHAVEFEGTGVTVNVVVPGGPADTPMVPDVSGLKREDLIPPQAMVAPIVWLASDAGHVSNGQRYVAAEWNTRLPEIDAAKACGSPIAWPDLALSPVWPGGKPAK